MEAEVCTLAAQLAAATCRFVLMIAELDRRLAWAEWGCKSMAHWLSFRCGVSLSTAREQVRVGRALAELPLTAEAFGNGTLSYSKVRALVRVATPQTEQQLIDFAQICTASQLERALGAYIASGNEAAREQHLNRSLHDRSDGNGGVSVTIHMTADAAASFRAAIDAALAEAPKDASADAYDPIAARRADALEVVVRSFVEGTAPSEPRAEVLITTDLATLQADDLGEVERTLTCDARLTMADKGGTAHDVTTRIPPRWLRRRLARRDRGVCRFPGCTNARFLHAHHIVHFAHGGPTSEANLVLLCSFHHRLVHAGGWQIRGLANTELTFRAPTGRVVTERPEVIAAECQLASPPVNERTIATAHGERMDLDWTVTALVSLLAPHDN